MGRECISLLVGWLKNSGLAFKQLPLTHEGLNELAELMSFKALLSLVRPQSTRHLGKSCSTKEFFWKSREQGNKIKEDQQENI